MKAYPSIVTAIDFRHVYHVFDKLDGSNIRAEWNPKRGFYKFGTRTQLLSSEQVILYPAIEKIQQTYGEALHDRFMQNKFSRVVAFFEYAGPQSFAGSHFDPVETMGVTLFDLAVHQKGFLPPEQFLAMAEGLPTPTLLHIGRIDADWVEAVRVGTMPGITFEGVIGKGPFIQKEGGPLQFKVKTQAWLKRLCGHCGDDESLFERLR